MRFGVLAQHAPRYAFVSAALLACSGQASQADIFISKDATQNMSCSAGICTPTSHKAILNVGELARMLKRGDVKVAPSSAASDIEVTASLTWTNNTRLTLDAYHSIAVLQPVTVAGPGGITIVVNDGGKGGDYSFSGRGGFDFWDTNASLVIDNQTFVLVNSIGALANAIAANPNGAFALAKDYDASVDGTYGASPVATDFAGTFDGLGHQVASLTVNDPSTAVNTETGFFVSTTSAAVVRDISFPHIYMRGGIHGYLGGIVGENKGSIFHAAVAGLIDGQNMSDFIGAIAGESYGTVRDTHFTGTAMGGSGLVGYNHGLVDQSDSTGLVSSYKVRCEATGGFYGALVAINGGTVSHSHSTSAIKNHVCAASVGGLVGGNAGLITHSYATGNVTTVPGKPGGLAGSTMASSCCHLRPETSAGAGPRRMAMEKKSAV
jgi:The GLUG motif